jgi:hypothetical protein
LRLGEPEHGSKGAEPGHHADDVAHQRRRAEAGDELHAQHANECAQQQPERCEHQRIKDETAETPVRLQDSPYDAIEQNGPHRAIHVHDLPPGRPREIVADDVFPAQEQVARLHLPAVAVGGDIPGGGETFGVVLGAADLSGQPVEFAGAAEFAPEHPVIFGQPARVVALYIDDEPFIDLHGRDQSTSSGSLPVGLPELSRVIFSTRASACCSSSSQLFLSASPRS